MEVKTSMLEYSKQILEKVSFDPLLFKKELRKAADHLMESEMRELEAWCLKHYERQYYLSRL